MWGEGCGRPEEFTSWWPGEGGNACAFSLPLLHPGCVGKTEFYLKHKNNLVKTWFLFFPLKQLRVLFFSVPSAIVETPLGFTK